MSNYGKVPNEDAIDHLHSSDLQQVLRRPSDEETALNTTSHVESFEMDLGDADDIESFEWPTSTPEQGVLTWKDPWLLNVLITTFMVTPLLTSAIFTMRDFTGRMWPSFLFSIHLAISLWSTKRLIPADEYGSQSQSQSMCRQVWSLILDLSLFGYFYSRIWNVFISSFFTEIDGTTVIEWADVKADMELLRLTGQIIASSRLIVSIISICFRCYRNSINHNARNQPRLPRMVGTGLAWLELRLSLWSVATTHRVRHGFLRLLWILLGLSILLLGWCINSAVVFLMSSSPPIQVGDQCDPLDTTECCLPFPSFHHLVPDNTTVTGWRVNLRGNTMPPLKGGMEIDATFLNKLDGFSTMAPLLFYLDGLKEAHEAANNTVRLQGHEDIELSVTNRSITLLIDMSTQTLVPHSAEIDYLDAVRPLVLVFPAQPLQHNTHYSLAVIGATDSHGKLLPQTPGMKSLFKGKTLDAQRFDRFRNKILPALKIAAPWAPEDSSEIQLLFDFQTISAESQLGPVRKVRDATINIISNTSWGKWNDHVRLIRTVDGVCSRNGTQIARTIHAELDVPWFIKGFGAGHRIAKLDMSAVESRVPTTMGSAKFVVHVPCSVRAAAINAKNATTLRAIMDYGHGLFSSRDEASEDYLQKMANDEGYLIMAMDWRGMSSYDLPMVIKTLMAEPSLFHAVRDNLIQGYANKYALQHFSRNGMLEMEWLQFHNGFNRDRPIPTFQNTMPASVYYGNSQGGILGAGYVALSGPTKLIDRAILGAPGTPFALVMSRSLDFSGYDTLLLLNFYTNRHIRILLYLTQMAWDSVEGSGVLAGPKTEDWPRMLLQAGLGDPIVPSLAAEALARGLGAYILPGNPREIFGLSIGDPASNSSLGPNITLTEMYYEREYASLPADDRFAPRNDVHICVRREEKFINQIKEFVNTGRVVDPCLDDDRCHRRTADCYLPWRD